MFSIAVILFSSCLREECEKNETGTLCIINQTANEVTVSVDGGATQTLDPNEEYCAELSAKVSHSLHAEDDQIIPQEWDENNITVVQCENTDFDIQ